LNLIELQYFYVFLPVHHSFTQCSAQVKAHEERPNNGGNKWTAVYA